MRIHAVARRTGLWPGLARKSRRTDRIKTRTSFAVGLSIRTPSRGREDHRRSTGSTIWRRAARYASPLERLAAGAAASASALPVQQPDHRQHQESVEHRGSRTPDSTPQTRRGRAVDGTQVQDENRPHGKSGIEQAMMKMSAVRLHGRKASDGTPERTREQLQDRHRQQPQHDHRRDLSPAGCTAINDTPARKTPASCCPHRP